MNLTKDMREYGAHLAKFYGDAIYQQFLKLAAVEIPADYGQVDIEIGNHKASFKLGSEKQFDKYCNSLKGELKHA